MSDEGKLQQTKAHMGEQLTPHVAHFWLAEASGRDLKQANERFAELLFQKNLYYLQVANCLIGYTFPLDYESFRAADETSMS